MTKTKELEALTNGQGCFAKSEPDEPLFILCARDVYAATTVRAWARRMLANHGQTAKSDEAFALADAMDVWREAHGGGTVPD